MDDELFIFRPSSVDVWGADLIRQGRIDTYPFTRKELVTRELNRLRELTLETLLVYKTRSHLLQNNEQIPVANLKGKNVLVWMSSLSDEIKVHFFEKLYYWYMHTKKIHDELEVVFVLYDKPDDAEEFEDRVLSRIMPWLVCPFDAEHTAFVLKELSGNCFVEFGKDGRVRSLSAHYLVDIDVDESGTIPFGSRYDLRRDVIVNFFHRYRISMM